MQLNINTNASIIFTNTLEKMGRSAMPVTVRSALNSTAFDVKSNTMPREAAKTFVQRKPTFFKASSKVDPATGFSISTMQAIVGFIPKQGTDKSVDDLQQQEHGGTIGGRSFIPLKQARTSGSWRKNVRAQARISQIVSQIVDSNDANGKNAAEKFIKSAIHAGKGGFVLGNQINAAGNKTLYQVRSIIRAKGNTVVKVVPLFAVQGGRKVNPKATHFMEHASLQSSAKIEIFYKKAAEHQIKKLQQRN